MKKLYLTILIGMIFLIGTISAGLVFDTVRDKIVPVTDAVAYEKMGLPNFVITKNEKVSDWEICFYILKYLNSIDY